jgi:hypothetical protein
LAIASEHFKAANPRVRVSKFQEWRTALSADRVLPQT